MKDKIHAMVKDIENSHLRDIEIESFLYYLRHDLFENGVAVTNVNHIVNIYDKYFWNLFAGQIVNLFEENKDKQKFKAFIRNIDTIDSVVKNILKDT